MQNSHRHSSQLTHAFAILDSTKNVVHFAKTKQIIQKHIHCVLSSVLSQQSLFADEFIIVVCNRPLSLPVHCLKLSIIILWETSKQISFFSVFLRMRLQSNMQICLQKVCCSDALRCESTDTYTYTERNASAA